MNAPAPHGVRQELRELWKLAAPMAVAQAGQALMGAVDTAVVGRAGTEALAAVGLSNALFFAVASFAIGLLMGVDPLISQAYGAGNAGRARQLLWQGSWLAVGVGALLAVPLMTVPALPRHLGLAYEGQLAVEDYMAWRAPSMPFMLLFLASRSYLQAAARTRPLVVATVVANVVNLGADVLLVFGGAGLPEAFGPLRAIPAMGARGAALATTVCSVVQWGVVAWAVSAVPVPAGPVSRRPLWPDMARALKVGLPIGLHIAAEVGVFALAGVLARVLGPESVSAHQLAISCASLSFTVALGIGNAGSVRVGWAVGARNTAQARLSGRMAFAAGAGFMALCALLFALFAEPLARLMGAPAEVLPLVVPLLGVTAVFQLSDGVQGVGAGVLRGAGDTRFTFLANMLGHYAVGLPVALALGFGLNLGVLGLWWGLCAGLTAVALALLWRFERLAAGTLQPLES